MSKRMLIYCTGCGCMTLSVLVNGTKIYPHRPDLSDKKFFQCPVCGNYVGTHRDGRPLGTIPTPELRRRNGLVVGRGSGKQHCQTRRPSKRGVIIGNGDNR